MQEGREAELLTGDGTWAESFPKVALAGPGCHREDARRSVSWRPQAA